MVAGINYNNVNTAVQCNNGLAPAMATDYFGSQIFGANPFCQGVTRPIFEGEPDDFASLLVQKYAYEAYEANPQKAPTMQDYVKATQIADMFSNNYSASAPQYTNFYKNDIFAQNSIPNLYNNRQVIA